jgi:hypothetical protein
VILVSNNSFVKKMMNASAKATAKPIKMFFARLGDDGLVGTEA